MGHDGDEKLPRTQKNLQWKTRDGGRMMFCERTQSRYAMVHNRAGRQALLLIRLREKKCMVVLFRERV